MFKKFNESEIQSNHAEQSLRESGFYCAACLNYITRAEEKIRKQGAHQHVCTNPANRTFRIGCFREARGCTIVGHPTGEHTWFPGYAWAVALCGKCGEHLGWKFTALDDDFHGIILSKVLEK